MAAILAPSGVFRVQALRKKWWSAEVGEKRFLTGRLVEASDNLVL